MHMRLVLLVAALAACGGTTGSETPAIDTVTPAFGPLSGGTRIVITGSGFLRDGATPDRVLFGTNESPQAGVVDDFTLEATLPASAMAGDVPITVFNRNGNVMLTGKFHYSAEPVISSVSPKNVVYSSTNTTVTLTGTGFKDENAGIATVLVNGVPAIDVQVQSDTQLTFTATAGVVLSRPDITLTNKRGTSIKDNAYRYIPFENPGLILFPKNSTTTFLFFY
ncbi:MAG: cell surface receptor protein, partial [Myxococcales bacterium]|nr:cell surface receptor protein [Myxococcales bacterium]